MRNPRKLKNGGKDIEKREERIRGGQSRGKVNTEWGKKKRGQVQIRKGATRKI